MLIDIVSDTICPWCFIGKRRLERALAQRPDLDVQIGWRPFQLNPDMPREGMDRQTYLALKFGGEDRAQRIYDTIRETGAEEGIDFRYDLMQRTPNTLRSHQLIRWAGSAGVQHALVEILFRRYFLEGEDIGDAAILVAAAAEVGMDSALVKDLLDQDSDMEQVQAEDKLAREMGIQGVPFFIIDRKYAVTGAQDAAVFLQVFDYVQRESGKQAAT